MKRKLRRYAWFTVLVVTLSFMNISSMYATPEYSGSQGWFYYPGEYYKKITGNTYYVSLNEYSAKEDRYSDGALYIYKNNAKEPVFSGHIWRIGKNKYKCTPGDYKKKKGKTYFNFTVKKKTIVVKQKRTVIKGISINGTYKIKKRLYS